MDLIPKIKKTICSFLTSEEGKISKQSLLLLGTLASTAAIASLSSQSVHAQCSCGGGGGCGGGGCAAAGATAGSGSCSGCSGVDAGCASASGDGGGCFTYNQFVLTPEGAKEISKIEVGSKVISYDEKADTFAISMVGRVIVHDGKTSFLNNFQKHPLIKLSIKVNDEVLVTKVTENHPYFDVTNQMYKQLKEFKVGDKVKTIKGDGVIVDKLILIDGNSYAEELNEIVYNLEMKEGPQNYIVNGAVVHNGGGGGK